MIIDEGGNVIIKFPRKNWQLKGWHDHRLDGQFQLRRDVVEIIRDMPLPKEAYIATLT